MRSDGPVALLVKNFSFPERGGCITIATDVPNESAEKQILHLEGREGAVECMPVSWARVISSAL